jgi:D-3-phosphoglycerate dehydrogenase
VILVNTARGGLIDELALQNCLKEGRISFACLDVFEDEPYCGPLCSLENVILSPHIGSYAREARVLMERKAVENLLKGLHEVGVL